MLSKPYKAAVPNLSAPGSCFMEDNFSMDGGGGAGSGGGCGSGSNASHGEQWGVAGEQEKPWPGSWGPLI